MKPFDWEIHNKIGLLSLRLSDLSYFLSILLLLSQSLFSSLVSQLFPRGLLYTLLFLNSFMLIIACWNFEYHLFIWEYYLNDRFLNAHYIIELLHTSLNLEVLNDKDHFKGWELRVHRLYAVQKLKWNVQFLDYLRPTAPRKALNTKWETFL